MLGSPVVLCLPLGPGRSLHQEYFAMHCDEGNGNLENIIWKAQSHDYCPPGPRL